MKSKNTITNLSFNNIEPIYKIVPTKTSSVDNFNFSPSVNKKSSINILNFTGITFIDQNYQFLKHLILTQDFDVIITDSDLLSYDKYKPLLEYIQSQDIDLIFYYDNQNINKDSIAPQGAAKRIYKAVNKLRSEKFDVFFCQGLKNVQSFINKRYNKKISIQLNGKNFEPKPIKKYFTKDDVNELKNLIRPKPNLILIKNEEVA